MQTIAVLRLGHRRKRDKRVTTHCALVARAFGADKIILSGEQDDAVLESVASLSRRWGGRFSAAYESNWKAAVRAFKKKGRVVHLTMYGEPFGAVTTRARKTKNLMIVVGAEKVPREMYELADYNASVGNQPHSEVAALAVFLY
ncbi:MAG: tRNA (cytidine(56)-2'-O)-methyltransferase, partial [Candidatus Micrarchaeota archaeon]